MRARVAKLLGGAGVRAFVRLSHAWVFGAVAFTIAVVALLGARRRYDKRAVFPSSPPVARLAIRGPLARPDLTVMATMRASEKRATPTWITVDSGATGVTMPGPTFSGLGLDVLTGVTVRSEDPLGRVQVRDAGLVPQLSLGELVVEDVVTAIGGDATVLGQSVLAHGTWDIDWDRGLLTLGGDAWPEGGETTFVPLRKEGDAEIVTVSLDGAPVEMIVDTGARVSTIPEAVGARANLAMRRVKPMTLHALGGGELLVRRLFSGEVRLGAKALGTLELAALPTAGHRAAYGLLGLDVLSRFHVQIVPGSHLALRPRGDVRKTVRERIARWSFVPSSCEHLGCVRAERGDDRLTLTLDADLARPIDLLLGCADEHLSGHVQVRLPSGPRGAVSKTSLSGFECQTLQVLDLAPVDPIGAVPTEVASKPESELQAVFLP
ncbi:MAG: retroviral-like aspartic protease family protein [Polyangiales bacterium]